MRTLAVEVILRRPARASAEILGTCSADTDFARFSEVRWENPVAVGVT
jgi:hypothetical protein